MLVPRPKVVQGWGGSLRQKLGSLALSAALESSPSGDVASEVAKQVPQSQGSGGGSGNEGKTQQLRVSPVLHVSPQERLVSPHKSLKRAREGEEKVSSSSSRRQEEGVSIFPDGSPQMGGGWSSVTSDETTHDTSSVSPVVSVAWEETGNVW